MNGKDGRNWLAAAMAAAVLVSCGCAGAAMGPSTQTPTPPAQPAQASVTVCNRTPSGCASEASYSLGTLRDLAINVAWSNLRAGTHTQTTEILEPSGGLFEVKSQAFAIDDNSNGTMQTEEILPVSGTWITQRRVAGAWKVRVSLDTTMSVTQTVQVDP
ncbi:MAG TPA: hypothetical protein VG051_04750 [Candidatus Acidoferrum sp.]|jgi:hypothetical protein|nr:hypothetical protein [Candidatus Acidoferrum sp.]